MSSVSTIEHSPPRRNKAKSIRGWRLGIQISFALLVIWIGIEFHYFVEFLESGDLAQFSHRPPGVEGFLPISSLMSLYYFALSGNVHPGHPAGMFILSAIIVLSIVFGKGFCSWLCPAGFISEMLGDLGEKIFKRRMFLPRWIDWPLRSLKYLVLAFFTYSIFVTMSELALKVFLDSPYNLMSDVKMYYFFADISLFALIVVVSLFVLSIVIRNFWCRFLCPYGALLGIATLISPNRIKRNEINCIDCAKCAKVCPCNIKVDKHITVVSDECHSCLNCVDICPVENTLQLQVVGTNRKLSKWAAAIGIVTIFLLICGFGMLIGQWQNDLTPHEYLRLQQTVRSTGHPTSISELERLNSPNGSSDP